MEKLFLKFFLIVLLALTQVLWSNDLEKQFWVDYQKLLEKILVKKEFEYHKNNFIHSGVNYRRLYDNESELLLSNQLARLNLFNPENMKRDSKNTVLAFWINVYNFFTILEIKKHYPISSMRKIGWKDPIVIINGEKMSLDDVEHGIIRPRGEPRIHFAINCASVSCPTLSGKIYEGNTLNEQLDFAVRNALRNPLNLRVDSSFFGGSKMSITKIFSWFGKDFGNKDDILDFIHTHAPEKYKTYRSFSFIDYDWNINTPENIDRVLDELILKLP